VEYLAEIDKLFAAPRPLQIWVTLEITVVGANVGASGQYEATIQSLLAGFQSAG
jgi:hypothetical protein